MEKVSYQCSQCSMKTQKIRKSNLLKRFSHSLSLWSFSLLLLCHFQLLNCWLHIVFLHILNLSDHNRWSLHFIVASLWLSSGTPPSSPLPRFSHQLISSLCLLRLQGHLSLKAAASTEFDKWLFSGDESQPDVVWLLSLFLHRLSAV